jgi:hypothetical protein
MICVVPMLFTCFRAAFIRKVASERLGHSKIRITLDLCSHVLPTLQARPRLPLTRHDRPSSLFHAHTKKN